MAKPKADNKMTVEDMINKAVAAQRISGERQAQDAYKATENRLYAYPVILLKITNDRERIEEIKLYGAPGGSRSVVRYQRSGMRLSADEIAETLVQDLTADIAASEHEVGTINKALEIIKNDPYADIINYRYFEGKNDDETAEVMSCDPSTVRRNKSRIVRRLAIFLYGTAAVA